MGELAEIGRFVVMGVNGLYDVKEPAPDGAGSVMGDSGWCYLASDWSSAMAVLYSDSV